MWKQDVDNKTGIHRLLQCRQGRAEPRTATPPQVTHMKSFAKYMWFLRYTTGQTDIQTLWSQYFDSSLHVWDNVWEQPTCHCRTICHNKLRTAELSPFSVWLLLILESYTRQQWQTQQWRSQDLEVGGTEGLGTEVPQRGPGAEALALR